MVIPVGRVHVRAGVNSSQDGDTGGDTDDTVGRGDAKVITRATLGH